MPSWLKAALVSLGIGLALLAFITYLYITRWPHG